MQHRILLLVISAIVTQTTLGQSAKQFAHSADSLYKQKQYALSFQMYKKALALGDSAIFDLYNGACSALLAGKKSETYTFLNLSVKKGYSDVEHIKIDSDLITLHNDSEWTKLIAKVQKNKDSIEANYDKPLMAELKQIYHDDQDIRTALISAQKKYGWHSMQVDSLAKIMHYTDSLDLIKVTAILDEKGFIGDDKVGIYNTALWLVIQHSDLKVQQKYLPALREAVKNGKAKGTWLALTEDRVALREGKKQIYGSQIGMDDKTNTYYVSALEDPDNVDKRRAEVGLGPLADYAKNWNITWNVEEYKKHPPETEKPDKK